MPCLWYQEKKQHLTVFDTFPKMGCVNSLPFKSSFENYLPSWLSSDEHGKEKESSEKPQYSWDIKRLQVDVSKFTFEDSLDSELIKLPGDINGKKTFEIFGILSQLSNL